MDLSQMSNAGSKYASETTHLIGSLISTAVLITDRLISRYGHVHLLNHRELRTEINTLATNNRPIGDFRSYNFLKAFYLYLWVSSIVLYLHLVLCFIKRATTDLNRV